MCVCLCVCVRARAKYSSHFTNSARMLEALSVRWSERSSSKDFPFLTCWTAAFRQGGARWSDSGNVNNKALKVGGRPAEVMHNSSSKLIKSPFLCPLQLLGTRRVISFLALPPPLPGPRQLREKPRDGSWCVPGCCGRASPSARTWKARVPLPL